jgi:hypothetical protein
MGIETCKAGYMDKDKLISELDSLTEVEADFMGWVCSSDRYDPNVIGYDEVVEILEHNLDMVNSKRSAEILKNEKVTAEELKALKEYMLEWVATSFGEETSYWVGPHPNEDVQAYVGMYQYEDGSRDLADLFENYKEAAEFGLKAGFDLVGN